MDFQLSDEYKLLQRTVRRFAENEIMPLASVDKRGHRFPREIIAKMGKLGFFGAPYLKSMVVTTWGSFAHVVACEEVARESCSIGVAFNTQAMGTARTILEFGTEGQRKLDICRSLSAPNGLAAWQSRIVTTS
jgi:alkylation response protein AidB-like acyl-CoA dehydrogenase